LLDNGYTHLILEEISQNCKDEECYGQGALKAWKELSSFDRNTIKDKAAKNGGKIIVTCGSHADDIETINTDSLSSKCVSYATTLQFDAINLRLNYLAQVGKEENYKLKTVMKEMGQKIQAAGFPYYLTVQESELDNETDTGDGAAKLSPLLHEGIKEAQEYVERLFIRYNSDMKLDLDNYWNIFGQDDETIDPLAHKSSLSTFDYNNEMPYNKIIPFSAATDNEPDEDNNRMGDPYGGYKPWESQGEDDMGLVEFTAMKAKAQRKLENNQRTVTGLGAISLRVQANLDTAQWVDNYADSLNIGVLFVETEAKDPPCDDANCEVCVNVSVCDECKANYTLPGDDDDDLFASYKFDSPLCVPDCTVLDHCLDCEDLDACMVCEEDYELDDDNTCQIVCEVENCQSCSEKNICEVCEKNYHLDEETNECQESIECDESLVGCSYCKTSATYCDECEEGYENSFGLCVAGCVDENCASCPVSPEVCHQCKEGYLIDNLSGQCVMRCTLEGCDSCFAPNMCDSCQSSYGLIGSMCETCEIENCQNCDGDSSSCRVCQDDIEFDEENLLCSGHRMAFGLGLMVWLLR